jgi:hypothetical protein
MFLMVVACGCLLLGRLAGPLNCRLSANSSGTVLGNFKRDRPTAQFHLI